MLRNSLRTAFRHLLRNKVHSGINLFGLSVAIASGLLITFFVRNELSYDRHYRDADRIYRVAVDIRANGGNRMFARTTGPLGPTLKKDFPQVESFVRLMKADNRLVRYGERKFYEEQFYFADPQVFGVFDWPLIEGNPALALSRPATVVIAEEMAHKYFGAEQPLGKMLKINDKDYEVTGVMRKPVHNSHLKVNFLTSMAVHEGREYITSWEYTVYYTFIKIKPKVDVAELGRRIEPMAKPHVGPNNPYHYFLQPIRDIHLHSNLYGETEPPGNATNVYVFSVVGLLILLIACLNFVNLTTAQATRRAKEVGVRKVIGANRPQLVKQFIGESLWLILLALTGALAMVPLALPTFSDLSGHAIRPGELLHPFTALTLVIILLVAGICSAIYPALVLSSFRPIPVLKGLVTLGNSRGTLLRKGLVVTQFAISSVLIIGTVVVFRQLHFMKNQQLGFNREQLLVLPIKGGNSIEDRYESVKQEFMRDAAVKAATVSDETPGNATESFAAWLVGQPDDKGQPMNYLFVDSDFMRVYGIGLKAGRAFRKELRSDDTAAFVVNEATAKAFGFATPEAAIGKPMRAGFSGREGMIIGVCEDFHYRSLQNRVEPLIMAIKPDHYKSISLKISTQNVPQTLAAVEQKWKELFPEHPFEYFFLDESFDNQYRSDEKLSRIFFTFTLLTILIACLGLFGLATFTAERRTKEIGIRKVLGASVSNIVTLLSKDFLQLVLIANVLAWPLAYYAMHRWLQDFAYRISIGWWVFVLAGASALVIALLTVSFQAIRVATANPVKSLRTE